MAEWIDELAVHALDSDESSWNKLFHAITPRLWGLFRRLGNSAVEAEDLIQETWTRVFKNRDQFDRERRFEPYIFAIATRAWIDVCRKNQRLPTRCQVPEDEPGASQMPLDMLFAAERAEQVRECLEGLSDEEKTIIVLRFWQDLTNRLIAERLQSTEPSIRSKGYRTLTKLADCLQL